MLPYRGHGRTHNCQIINCFFWGSLHPAQAMCCISHTLKSPLACSLKIVPHRQGKPNSAHIGRGYKRESTEPSTEFGPPSLFWFLFADIGRLRRLFVEYSNGSQWVRVLWELTSLHNTWGQTMAPVDFSLLASTHVSNLVRDCSRLHNTGYMKIQKLYLL